jgi:membrane protein DedA with SNARE-associated domain
MLTPGLLLFIQQAAETVGEHAADLAQYADVSPEKTSVFEHITAWCVNLIDITHYPGVFLLMALESMIAPIPSEAVMPFAGFLAYEGRMSMVWIGIFSTLGSLVGSGVSYWLGMYGGRPLVLKVGKYFLLNVHHLDATERFFNRFGNATVFICRFIPVIRHFISIPAGMGRMPLVPFLMMTLLGAAIWNMFLAWAGWKLNENWESLRGYFHYIDITILVIIIAVIVAFIVRQIVEFRAQKLNRIKSDID